MACKNLSIKTIFVYEPYLKTTKLGYWFIALNIQKCGKVEGKTETSCFPEDKNFNRKKVLIRKFHKKKCLKCPRKGKVDK